MDKEEVKKYARTLGLECVGIAPAVVPAQDEHKEICPLAAGKGLDRYDAKALLPDCQSIIVVLFPYYNGNTSPANLSLYAQCSDYHKVIQDYLGRLGHCLEIAQPGCQQYICVDTSPLCDRWLAYQAGLGILGDNQCLIHPLYGSFCFIGSILTTLELLPDTPMAGECHHCGNCRTSCPGQCFTGDTYDYKTCKSYLTQKKGGLTPPEVEVIKKTSLIFGCDECQRVCPYNADIPLTPIPEFRENRLAWLAYESLVDKTNRQFKASYGNRAFSWRGKAILLRNMDYLGQKH
jgi:epoxyqueuosine reductase QueG